MLRTYAVAASLAILTTACNMENIKKGDLGAMTGAVLGGVLGNTACKNSSKKALCTMVGAVAGSMLGQAIGKHLDEKDRQRHAQVTSEVLASKTDNSGAWENPENGTSGKVTVVKENKTTQNADIPVLKDKVESVQPLELIGEMYTTNKSVNVRVGPGTDYKKAPPALKSGSEFNVIGRVIDKPNWLMIATDGAASGYVYAPLVQPSGVASSMVADSSKPKADTIQVSTVQTCKTVNHEITYKDGKKEVETVEMCQRGDGSWDIV